MHKGFALSIAAAVSVAGLCVRAELPNWTVTWTNDAHTVGLCSNDQNSFVLNVYRDADSAHKGFGLAIGLKGATEGSSIASVNGLEYLDLRGAISGLDHRVDPATNAVWKFSRFTNLCFKPNDGTLATPAQYITGLHSPGTLVADSSLNTFHVDGGGPNPKNTKEYILDEPNVTTRLGNWYLNSVGGLTNLVFRVPKITELIDPLCHMATSWKTDVGKEWDLSGIQYVGGTTSTAAPGSNVIGLGTVAGMTGVLRLPSLRFIAASPTDNGTAFRGIGIGEAELGMGTGQLVRFAPHSFKDCNSLTNLVIGASPAGQTLVVCTNAFRCKNLKTIYFNGEKPDIKGQTTCPSFGTTATPEGQITFYVRDLPSWADVLAEADANGGFVSAATMGTAARQKVARFPGFVKTTVELQDPRFADIYHETVTIEKPAIGVGNGEWTAGAVTLTAACADPDDAATDPRRSKFLRWDGVPVALERQNPLTFTPTKDSAVKAVFAHDWLISDDAEPNRVMENRIWRLCCWKRDTDKRQLGTGKATDKTGKGTLWPVQDRLKGGGDLNLNGDIWDSQGEKWTLVSCCSFSPWSKSATSYSCPTSLELQEAGLLQYLPTRLTLPETLLYWPGEVQNYDSWDNASGRPHWPIEELIAICPLATGSIGAFTVGGACYIRRLVLRVPKITTIGNAKLTWSGSGFPDTDLDEWDLSGITTVRDDGFGGSVNYQFKGTLDLPNVVTVGTNAFKNLASTKSIVLGTNGLTLASLGDMAFSGTPKLETLVLGTKRLTIGSKLPITSPFEKLTALKTLRIPGRVLPQETVDAILTAVPESAAAKQVTIYASPYSHWDRLAAALTDGETALAPANCFGVYREGSRKAWFVTERSEFEPNGLLLLVR